MEPDLFVHDFVVKKASEDWHLAALLIDGKVGISKDRGRTWTFHPPPSQKIKGILYRDHHVIVWGDNGVFIAEDDRLDWLHSTPEKVTEIFYRYGFLMGALWWSNGLIRSRDWGRTWEEISFTGLPNRWYVSFPVSEHGIVSVGDDHVFFSCDDGDTWSTILSHAEVDPYAVAFTPTATFLTTDDKVLTFYSNRVVISFLPFGQMTDIFIEDGAIMVGDGDDRYISRDGGSTWEETEAFLSTTFFFNRRESMTLPFCAFHDTEFIPEVIDELIFKYYGPPLLNGAVTSMGSKSYFVMRPKWHPGSHYLATAKIQRRVRSLLLSLLRHKMTFSHFMTVQELLGEKDPTEVVYYK